MSVVCVAQTFRFEDVLRPEGLSYNRYEAKPRRDIRYHSSRRRICFEFVIWDFGIVCVRMRDPSPSWEYSLQQFGTTSFLCFKFVICDLEIVWCLEFGAWNFYSLQLMAYSFTSLTPYSPSLILNL